MPYKVLSSSLFVQRKALVVPCIKSIQIQQDRLNRRICIDSVTGRRVTCPKRERAPLHQREMAQAEQREHQRFPQLDYEDNGDHYREDEISNGGEGSRYGGSNFTQVINQLINNGQPIFLSIEQLMLGLLQLSPEELGQLQASIESGPGQPNKLLLTLIVLARRVMSGQITAEQALAAANKLGGQGQQGQKGIGPNPAAPIHAVAVEVPEKDRMPVPNPPQERIVVHHSQTGERHGGHETNSASNRDVRSIRRSPRITASNEGYTGRGARVGTKPIQATKPEVINPKKSIPNPGKKPSPNRNYGSVPEFADTDAVDQSQAREYHSPKRQLSSHTQEHGHQMDYERAGEANSEQQAALRARQSYTRRDRQRFNKEALHGSPHSPRRGESPHSERPATHMRVFSHPSEGGHKRTVETVSSPGKTRTHRYIIDEGGDIEAIPSPPNETAVNPKKSMSALNNSSGGALVSPSYQRKRLTIPRLKSSRLWTS